MRVERRGVKRREGVSDVVCRAEESSWVTSCAVDQGGAGCLWLA